MADITIEQFEKEALAWLESVAERRPVEKAFVWGEGSDNFYREKDRDQEAKNAEEAKVWRQKKFDAGFGWISGPKEYGGRALPAAYDRLYNQLEVQFRVPDNGPFGISLGMVTPTIQAHGSQTARDAYVRRLWRGEMIACQLFSEPGAGSDLASLTTKAEKDGDVWVITGQKVWTTGAHYSDIGEIIARTDWDLPKHKGLTGFIVDMKDPNVEIRPLKQMTGGASFNEIFFNEVRVPDDHRLGDVNNGWNVALTTLTNERASIGTGNAGDGNLHPILLFDERDPDQLRRVMEASHEILDECLRLGGSVTGEHGIGVEKIDFMSKLFSPDDLAAMRRVRQAFNPDGLCSPDKMLPTAGACAEAGRHKQVKPGRRAAL